MYKLCKTEQSAARQHQFELQLLEAMKSERYEDISISDLCHKMGVPRKAFYRYFSCKDGALFALLDHTMLEFHFSSGHQEKPGGALGDLDRFFVFWYEHRSLLDALERNNLSGILVERVTEFARRERAMPQYMRNWDAMLQDMTISFALCGLISMVIQWHRKGFRQTPEEMTRIATAMLTQPLLRL